MKSYNANVEVFTFTTGGTIHHVTKDFVVEALQLNGCSIHSDNPFQIIDKVGFLKTEAESLDIAFDAVVDVFQQSIDKHQTSLFDSNYDVSL